LALVATLISPGAHAATRIGAVEQLTNAAFGIPPDAARGPKRQDDAIVFQETIETLEESAMLVRFNDSTELTIGEKAIVLMDEFVYAPKQGLGKLVISLSKGAFRFVSGNVPKGGVTIQTPSALIGIRGTELLILVALDGSTLISVISGLISLTPRFGGAAVAVQEDQSVEVSSDGEIGLVTDGVRPTGDRYVDLGVDFDTDGSGGASAGGDASGPARSDRVTIKPPLPSIIVRPTPRPSTSSPGHSPRPAYRPPPVHRPGCNC
jgi:hypothetical protein